MKVRRGPIGDMCADARADPAEGARDARLYLALPAGECRDSPVNGFNHAGDEDDVFRLQAEAQPVRIICEVFPFFVVRAHIIDDGCG